MKTNISEGIVNSIDNSLLTKDDVSSESSVEDINAPEFIKKLVVDSAKEEASNKLGEVITEKVTDICMTIVTFVIVILVVMIIMSLLQGLLKILSDIPLVDIVNKLAGGFFGIL
ncbi:MAG: CvpA family protein [Clostridia bacterium]|nr:CvpA family protein [Clostridia bacterium]